LTPAPQRLVRQCHTCAHAAGIHSGCSCEERRLEGERHRGGPGSQLAIVIEAGAPHCSGSQQTRVKAAGGNVRDREHVRGSGSRWGRHRRHCCRCSGHRRAHESADGHEGDHGGRKGHAELSTHQVLHRTDCNSWLDVGGNLGASWWLNWEHEHLFTATLVT
jgi:hypothetical protein